MAKNTTLLEKRHPGNAEQAQHPEVFRTAGTTAPVAEPLLREALGATLRGLREDAHRSLRDLADQAKVSPGYLSELERGRKEVSSELLASICHALGVQVSRVILEAAEMMAFDAAAAQLAAHLDEGGRPDILSPVSPA
ncbi:helix-turn-helix domain-containing protein [Corynebacterium nuruki]|uniref:helix-turn-helix domain-containing protein n=1 Tax=Corynebacterium nuruki TaxID=1032851 RepID=UPI0002485770|nr:helix-turn-helix transcriptional regulator [Corynebacterium nuruki]